MMPPEDDKRWVTVFSEARLLLDAAGDAWSREPAMGGMGWARGLASVPHLRIAARATPGEATLGDCALAGPPPVDLVYYLGVGGFLRSLPRLALDVDMAVASSAAVVIRMPGVIGWLAAASAMARRKPIAAEVVGDVQEVMASGSLGKIAARLARPAGLVTRWAVRRASAVRYVTERTLQRRYPPTRNALVTAYSSVSLPKDWNGNGWNRPPRPNHHLIAVGSHEQLYKGHDVLIRALAQLKTEFPRITLSLVGAGRSQILLRDMVKELDLGDSVEFLGYIGDKDELKERICESWVFVMPSRTEGLPRVLVEAMALGRPCVGTRVGGIPELLDAAQLVPPNDASALADSIADLLRSEDRRIAQQKRNLLAARAFLPDRLKVRELEWSESVKRIARPSGRGAS